MLDEFGEPMADQVWIQFGRIKNIKCVDYFRVTYTKTDKTGVTTITSDPIDRIEKGSQMTVVPCTLYTFRYCILLSSPGVPVSWCHGFHISESRLTRSFTGLDEGSRC